MGGLAQGLSVSDCVPLAAPIGLSPLLILTLCGPERVLLVSNGGGGGDGAEKFCAPVHKRPKNVPGGGSSPPVGGSPPQPPTVGRHRQLRVNR